MRETWVQLPPLLKGILFLQRLTKPPGYRLPCSPGGTCSVLLAIPRGSYLKQRSRALLAMDNFSLILVECCSRWGHVCCSKQNRSRLFWPQRCVAYYGCQPHARALFPPRRCLSASRLPAGTCHLPAVYKRGLAGLDQNCARHASCKTA